MFDPKSYEQKIVQYWRDTNVRDKWRDATKNGKKFYFLQGPPYTSGRVHLGTAWNNCVKDSVLRFKRMTGHNVWDRAGYDMHGLPTEQKVLKLHDLRLMSDIKAFGEEKFSEECLTFSTEQMRQMDIDFESFGISLDFSDSYQPVKTDYMEGVWQLIKKAHDTKRLYKGLRTMGWSAYFQTALAKHEMVYKTVTDTSIFVKFKLKGTKNEIDTLVNYAHTLKMKALLKVFFESGARTIEILNLRASNCHYNEQKQCWVIKLPNMKGISTAKMPIELDYANAVFDSWMKHNNFAEDAFVFSYSYDYLRTKLAKNGVKHLGRKITPKMFRKSCAMHLVNLDINEQYIKSHMGWSASSKAISHYIDQRAIQKPDKLKSAYTGENSNELELVKTKLKQMEALLLQKFAENYEKC